MKEREFLKCFHLLEKKYEKICKKIIASGAGGSKLEQKSDYVICELSLSHDPIFIQSLDTRVSIVHM